jgi:hypothetical protein
MVLFTQFHRLEKHSRALFSSDCWSVKEISAQQFLYKKLLIMTDIPNTGRMDIDGNDEMR